MCMTQQETSLLVVLRRSRKCALYFINGIGKYSKLPDEITNIVT